jgi:CRISPR-associated protein Cas1
MPTNLRGLPRIEDGLSFLFVEHAVIERENQSVAAYTSEGKIAIPAAGLAVLALGPGTRITHAAVTALAKSGSSILWVGEEAERFYAAGMGKARSSRNVLRQASAWADADERMAVVRRMYELRFIEKLDPKLTLQQVRGREGTRVRDAYAAASRDHGVPWSGRNYQRDNWGAADPVNRALSSGAALLYGICHGLIVAAGFSPAIGFIHTGKQLSFVYDLADLYKVDVLIPAAFEAAALDPRRPEARVRRLLRQHIGEAGLMGRALADLGVLFKLPVEAESVDIEPTDNAGSLWDPTGDVEGGKSHAGDDH